MRLTVFLLVLVSLVLSICPRSAAAQCNDCWLEVRGSEIVNATTGQPVILRAVGLGNWLLQEGYMLNPGGCQGCPGTQWQMKRQYLNEGQSIGQVEAFYAAWRDRFITKEDIDFIASLGFNSVRLPMHYELFLTAEQRAVRNAVITNFPVGHDAYKNSLRQWVDNGELFIDPQADGFAMIDRLIEWCEANGMYVILDLHAAPGAQGSDLNIADGFYANNLWQFPVFQDVTNQFWLSISNRYKDEPRIAMYEFINEPNNVPGGGQAIHALTQRLLTTVRNNGDNHIIGIHGNGWGNNYDFMEPSTFTPNWGLVYSAHRYWIDPAEDWVPDPNPNQINKMANLIAFRETHNVPVWVGETGENNNAWLSQNIAKLENAGIGWCHWTYKRHDWQQNAALARLGGNYPTDGAGAMATVLDSILYSNIIPNTNTIAAVTATLPPAGSTGCRAVSNLCAPVGSFVSIRGNNRLFVTTAQGQSGLTCTASAPGSAERFEVVDAGNGRVALRSANGNYVSSGNAQGDMTSDSPSIGALEQFEWLDLGNGTFALRGSNGLFVSSENGTRPMRCDRPVAQEWEGFTYELIESCVGDIADDIGTFGIDGQVNFGDFLSLLGRIGQCP